MKLDMVGKCDNCGAKGGEPNCNVEMRQRGANQHGRVMRVFCLICGEIRDYRLNRSDDIQNVKVVKEGRF